MWDWRVIMSNRDQKCCIANDNNDKMTSMVQITRGFSAFYADPSARRRRRLCSEDILIRSLFPRQ